jgi:hypothetical protein
MDSKRDNFSKASLGHPSILKIAFDVMTTVVELYRIGRNDLDVVADLMCVLIHMFCARVDKEGRFLLTTGAVLEVIDLETAVFWSLLFLFEGGEVRKLLELRSGREKVDVTKRIRDFIGSVNPFMAHHLKTAGVASFEGLESLVVGHLSNILSAGDCSDVWMAAISAPHFLDFTEDMISACLLFGFAGLINSSKSEEPNLMDVVKSALGLVRHTYVVAHAFMIGVRAEELIIGSIRD